LSAASCPPGRAPEKPLAFSVPDCRSKHAAQEFQAINAILSVESEDDLRVGVGVKQVARRYQFLTKFLKVVVLAVEDDGVSGDGVKHRLMSGWAEARVTEDANAFRRRPKAAIMRLSVADAGDHRDHRLAPRMGPPVQFAGYAADRLAPKTTTALHSYKDVLITPPTTGTRF